ncbi:MAG: S41 family peptidase, partial [Mariprofundaceae bacterium]
GVLVATLTVSLVAGSEIRSAEHYEDLALFTSVLNHVRSNYVEPVSEHDLLTGALNGMLRELDPHSAFMDRQAYDEMQVDTRGEFGGLGIEIVAAEGGIRVIAPIEDTPAYRAGILAGDLIIKIEDQLAKDMSLIEAVKIMRGKPGSSIHLTIFREADAQPIDVKIVRAVIKVKSVKSDLLAPGYVYLRIAQFQEKTSDQLKKQFADLRKRSSNKLHGAVLDLRNNPGGLLDQAVEVTDLFLDEGGIVSTKSRVGRNMSFEAQKGDLLHGLPLVVLINNGSASASEIVSGALQDSKRAVLMGTKTFGKGSVQRIVPLNDGTAFKLTTSLYYTPSGRSIQATGIEPDITVEQVVIKVEDKKKRISISERDLKGHLKNGNGASKQKKNKKLAKGEVSERIKERLSKDVQLQRALDLLKGLNAIQSKG